MTILVAESSAAMARIYEATRAALPAKPAVAVTVLAGRDAPASPPTALRGSCGR